MSFFKRGSAIAVAAVGALTFAGAAEACQRQIGDTIFALSDSPNVGALPGACKLGALRYYDKTARTWLPMLDDKEKRVRVAVPNVMGYDTAAFPDATYHAFWDESKGYAKPDDGRPVYDSLRPEFTWPAPG